MFENVSLNRHKQDDVLRVHVEDLNVAFLFHVFHVHFDHVLDVIYLVRSSRLEYVYRMNVVVFQHFEQSFDNVLIQR